MESNKITKEFLEAVQVYAEEYDVTLKKEKYSLLLQVVSILEEESFIPEPEFDSELYDKYVDKINIQDEALQQFSDSNSIAELFQECLGSLYRELFEICRSDLPTIVKRKMEELESKIYTYHLSKVQYDFLKELDSNSDS